MDEKRRIEEAKARFLAETEDRDWVHGVGIGRVDNALGLVITIRPSAKSVATRVLRRLSLRVPVSVRTASDINARLPRESDDSESFERLRNAARERFGNVRQDKD
ncbi:MAG: hypothetical protein AAF493_28785 [Pseudomonadota bacterium]